jgi:hypothetical protein
MNFIANGMSDMTYKIVIGTLSTFIGILGCYAWATFKGQSRWHGLWGLIMPLGIIPVLLLKDKNVGNKNASLP